MVYNASLGFEMLQTGSWSTAVGYVYTGVMDYWFWLIMFVAILIIAYINTQSEIMVGIFGMIGSVALVMYLPPSVHPVLYIFLVLSFGLTLYKLFKA
jgi:hypothetical protein